MTATVLRVSGLSARRGGRQVLADVGFSLASGEIAGVVGPNGAGKSTLLAALAGLLPSNGERELDGAPLAKSAVSYLPQAYQVRSGLSVLEVLLLGRRERLGWRISEDDLREATDVLERFSISALADRAMDTLSGGQQQIVLLAQRMMRNPRLLILDEPTSALDLHHQLAVFDVLSEFARTTGAIVIAAIHDLNLAAHRCDHILLLDGGRVASAGAPYSVLSGGMVSETYRIEADIVAVGGSRWVIVPQRVRGGR